MLSPLSFIKLNDHYHDTNMENEHLNVTWIGRVLLEVEDYVCLAFCCWLRLFETAFVLQVVFQSIGTFELFRTDVAFTQGTYLCVEYLMSSQVSC